MTFNKIVISKKVLKNVKIFNFYFINKIKDPYIDKVYKKSQLTV